jgi:hypothetical protein
MSEFVRFLELKKLTRDTDADKISPTPLMDVIWHAVVLDTRFYASLQQHLGLILHHRPEGALEPQQAARFETMRALYRDRFGTEPLTPGTDPRHDARHNARHEARHDVRHDDHDDNEPATAAPDAPADSSIANGSMSLVIEIQDGGFHRVRVPPGAVVRELKEKLVPIVHWTTYEMRLIGPNGEDLDRDASPLADAGVADGDTVRLRRLFLAC